MKIKIKAIQILDPSNIITDKCYLTLMVDRSDKDGATGRFYLSHKQVEDALCGVRGDLVIDFGDFIRNNMDVFMPMISTKIKG